MSLAKSGMTPDRSGALRLAAALTLWVLVTLLAWMIYAAPRWISADGDDLELAPTAFRVDGAEEQAEDAGLAVSIPAATSRSLIWTLGPWQAADYRFLRLELEGLGRERQLRLLWRRDGKPASATIPRSGSVVTLDLVRASKDWEGRIDDLAIEVRPLDLLAVEDAPPAVLRLRAASLLRDGHLPALAAMADEWAAQRRWIGRSINTSGLELGFDSPRPWLPAFLLAALLLWPALGWALRWRRAGWLRGGGVVALGLWLLLDLQSLRVQVARAERVAAVHGLAGEQGLAASPALARPLTSLRDELLAEEPRPVVFLNSEGAFLRDYPMFLLRPLNVGPLPKHSNGALPLGSVIVTLGKPLELRKGRLRLAGQRYVAEEIQRAPGVQALRLTKALGSQNRGRSP